MKSSKTCFCYNFVLLPVEDDLTLKINNVIFALIFLYQSEALHFFRDCCALKQLAAVKPEPITLGILSPLVELTRLALENVDSLGSWPITDFHP